MNKNRIIAGATANHVKEFLRKIDKQFTTSEAARLMTWKGTESATVFVGGLAAGGYLEGGNGHWTVTAVGEALAKAKLLHQFTRAEADKTLLSVVERAANTAIFPDFGYFVERLFVSGEYLTDAEEISELTFMARILPKPDTDLDAGPQYDEWLVERTLDYLAPRERRLRVIETIRAASAPDCRLIYSVLASGSPIDPHVAVT